MSSKIFTKSLVDKNQNVISGNILPQCGPSFLLCHDDLALSSSKEFRTLCVAYRKTFSELVIIKAVLGGNWSGAQVINAHYHFTSDQNKTLRETISSYAITYTETTILH